MRIVVLPMVGMILLACVACGGGSTDTGPVLAGAYELNSVNGTSMPATLSVSGSDTTYLEEELLIASPGGNYQTAGVTVTDGPLIFGQPVQFASSGTYSVSGSGYALADRTLGNGSATLDRGVLSVTFSKNVYVFSQVPAR